MMDALPLIDWSQEPVRPALNLILRRLDRLFGKIAKKHNLRVCPFSFPSSPVNIFDNQWCHMWCQPVITQPLAVGENELNRVSPWLCKLILGCQIYRFPKLFAVFQAIAVGNNELNRVSPWLCKLILGWQIYRFPKLFAVFQAIAVRNNELNRVSPWLFKLILRGPIYRFPILFAVFQACAVLHWLIWLFLSDEWVNIHHTINHISERHTCTCSSNFTRICSHVSSFSRKYINFLCVLGA